MDVLENNTWKELKVTNKAEGSRFSVLQKTNMDTVDLRGEKLIQEDLL